jgi:hypothetical protein
MIEPEINPEERNVVGGIDRLVTNFALAILAVVPTLGTLMFMPWKLAPQLNHHQGDGRDGMLLAPGVFIALSLTITLLFSAVLATPDTLAENPSFIGPGLAMQVAEAAEQGNLWKTASTIAPIYFFAVLTGAIGALLQRWAGPSWNLSASLRAGFYVVATAVCWIVLSSAVIDWIRVSSGPSSLVLRLYDYNSVPILILPVWVYAGLFRGLGHTLLRSGLLAAAMFAMMLIIFIVVGLLSP